MTTVLIEDGDGDYCRVSVPLKSTYSYREPHDKTGEEYLFNKPLTVYKDFCVVYKDILLPYEFLQ